MDEKQTPPNGPRNSNCSFCGRPRGAFKEIVENPTGSVGICNDCIRICREILDAEERKRTKEKVFYLLLPILYLFFIIYFFCKIKLLIKYYTNYN